VAPVRRPLGVLGWSAGSDGIEVTAAPLGAWRKIWRADELQFTRRPSDPAVWTLRADAQNVPGPTDSTTVAFGIDADFGVYVDLRLQTTLGEATQRLRWIRPGSFWMGSPADEPERFDGEGPRHAVTLTRGFWLADTACTQALWQAVTGGDPSRFPGDPQLPVVEVSWNELQGFLRLLGRLLPGCFADLPSEAEWEYACRAGTQTPFSFGPTISPAQVNYDGNFPYAGGAEGEYRQTTVPVCSLPPNPWGLFEMHGNVWEWCADGPRDYTEDAQIDPRGPLDDTTGRAVRGGSWIVIAGWARSASRGADHPVESDDNLGFRLCLRSMEQDQLRPAGPSEASPGGHSPRDEAVVFFRDGKTPRK
jgi:formylglycine-generating enzyme required for sulfatase activity